MKVVSLFAAALSLGLSLQAAQTNSALGNEAAPWLKMSGSVKSVGMAEATVAGTGVDLASVNPAALAGVKNQEVSLMHNAGIQGTSLENLAYGIHVADGLALGLGVSYMNFGAVDKYTFNASNQLVADGSINPYGSSISLAGAYSMGGIDLGLALKMVGESLDGSSSASAFSGDFGARWAGKSGISAGLSVNNAFGQLNGANLPAQATLGLGYALALDSNSLNLEADFQSPFSAMGNASTGLGAEFWYNSMVAGRLGYRLMDTTGLGGLAGLSAGLGFRFNMAEINYAYVSQGDIGSANQLQLLLRY